MGDTESGSWGSGQLEGFERREESREWHECEHTWTRKLGDYDCPPGFTEVVCIHCNCPGERDDISGKVFWPAT